MRGHFRAQMGRVASGRRATHTHTPTHTRIFLKKVTFSCTHTTKREKKRAFGAKKKIRSSRTALSGPPSLGEYNKSWLHNLHSFSTSRRRCFLTVAVFENRGLAVYCFFFACGLEISAGPIFYVFEYLHTGAVHSKWQQYLA